MESAIQSLEVGPLGVNCYLVYPEEGGILYIIDPGDEPQRILKLAREYHPAKYRVMLTHPHIDHISGLQSVMKALGVEKATLNPIDEPFYRSPLNNLDPFMPALKDLPPTTWIDSEPDGNFTVIETPGHTEGSVCYYFKKLNAVFTGDTLFAGGIGRTDLPGSGTYEDLIFSIRERLYLLPDKTKVYPGHGKQTDIGFEKQCNPYTIR